MKLGTDFEKTVHEGDFEIVVTTSQLIQIFVRTFFTSMKLHNNLVSNLSQNVKKLEETFGHRSTWSHLNGPNQTPALRSFLERTAPDPEGRLEGYEKHFKK